jgi:hypothetical protein
MKKRVVVMVVLGRPHAAKGVPVSKVQERGYARTLACGKCVLERALGLRHTGRSRRASRSLFRRAQQLMFRSVLAALADMS